MGNNATDLEYSLGATGLSNLASEIRTLSVSLNLEFVFLAFATSTPVKIVRAVAVANHGLLAPTFEYDLTGGPCRLVYDNLETFIPCDVAERFPIDATFGWQGYIGVPLKNESGTVFGHIAALSSQPLTEPENMFAAMRATAKRLERYIDRHLRTADTGSTRKPDPATSTAGTQPEPDRDAALPNRQYFEARGQIAFDQARLLNRPLTVAYLALEDLKAAERREGKGTASLIAQTLSTIIRTQIGPQNGVGVRIGENEFAILLPIIPPIAVEDKLVAITAALRHVCQGPLFMKASISCGTAMAMKTSSDADFGTLLRRAQMAIFGKSATWIKISQATTAPLDVEASKLKIIRS